MKFKDVQDRIKSDYYVHVHRPESSPSAVGNYVLVRSTISLFGGRYGAEFARTVRVPDDECASGDFSDATVDLLADKAKELWRSVGEMMADGTAIVQDMDNIETVHVTPEEAARARLSVS